MEFSVGYAHVESGFQFGKNSSSFNKILISFRYKTELAAQTPTMAQAKSKEE
jgi:hypothetical protein